jgi:hypothetical protein
MFGYIKARSAARQAKRAYEMAVLESLMAENRRRIEELERFRKCPWCAGIEAPEQREVCTEQFLA